MTAPSAGERLGERIAVGRTADVYALGPDQVVKVLRAGVADEEAELEARAARAVTAANLDAPALIETTRVDGRAALVYERVRGPSMLALLLEDPSRIGELAEVLGRMHAVMHDRDGSTLPDGAERLRDAVRRATPYAGAELAQAALERIDRLPTDLGVCHGDFHPANVIMADAGPVAIDWLTATAGPTAADVARTLLLLRDSATTDDLDEEEVRQITVLRDTFATAYLQAYVRARPIDRAIVAAWRLPIVVARLAEGIPAERARFTEEARREL